MSGNQGVLNPVAKAPAAKAALPKAQFRHAVRKLASHCFRLPLADVLQKAVQVVIVSQAFAAHRKVAADARVTSAIVDVRAFKVD